MGLAIGAPCGTAVIVFAGAAQSGAQIQRIEMPIAADGVTASGLIAPSSGTFTPSGKGVAGRTP